MASQRHFARSDDGASALEFALLAPLSVFLLLGMAEVARYGMFRQELSDRVAGTLDLVSRIDPTSVDTIDAALSLAEPGLAQFHAEGQIRAIASGVALMNGEARVAWQREIGELSTPSRIGAVGAAADIPPGLLRPEVPTLVTLEIMVTYQSWLLQTIASHEAHDVAYGRPRRIPGPAN